MGSHKIYFRLSDQKANQYLHLNLTCATNFVLAQVSTFPSLGSSACYRREGSSLSTASLPAVSPKRSISKSKIPLPTFSRENLSSGRSTPSGLTPSSRLKAPGFGSLNTLGLSNSSLSESVNGIATPLKFPRNGLSQQVFASSQSCFACTN